MSAYSKRAKRKVRKATRRKLAGQREPNGRLSRSAVAAASRLEMTEREAKAVALDARMRHTGLPHHLVDLNEAGRPNAGTVHGVLALTGAITLDQWQAAEWYLALRGDYMRSILAKGEATDREGPGHSIEDSEGYIDWCQHIGEAWARVLDCLRDIGVATRSPVAAAFDVILCRQQEMHHLIGDLRVGLNAIHKAFLGGRSTSSQFH